MLRSLKVFMLTMSLSFAAEAATCSAFTQCGWYDNYGFFHATHSVSCLTYGQGCTWKSVFNNFVECTGYNAAGQWVHFYFSCH